MPAFRYVLELLDGGEPGSDEFVTDLDGWKVGDMFLSGPGLERFRILAIDEEAPGVLAAACRRKIASSCRRTRISTSFERRRRPSSHTSTNRFRTTR
jgi:hypothetical protein